MPDELDLKNPFVGSQVKVTKLLKEPELQNLEGYLGNFKIKDVEVEDENERFIVYKNGLLVRKVQSEKKYFPNKT